ncbi:M23 family metallopeptidase [Oceaniferula spumae]|uniref:M23 family metallopeptidase n=1 Tax=Oceaniferula spumae TaxID=2979115 RepID=UPI003F4E48E5
MIRRILSLTLLLSSALANTVGAEPANVVLPTVNDHIFRGESEKFYMYVHRNFEGKASKAWTAGKYGFVRNLKRTEDGVIGTKFHEGIDIKPIKRNRSNSPMDEVKSIASGVVAYTNNTAGRSNYGKYLVIEHSWDSGPLFSLYAHLAEIDVKVGERVTQGQKIALMGYTGSGINRERSHLHLELNILLSTQFETWHNKHFNSKNYHGNHNGINMAGLDIAGFYIAQNRDKSLTIPRFIKSRKVYYKITVPRHGPLEVATRYPWLLKGDSKTRSPSWEIAFTASGFPVSISPSMRKVSAPRVTSVRKCLSKHEYHTKGFISGTGYRASLSTSGNRFIELITGTMKQQPQ